MNKLVIATFTLISLLLAGCANQPITALARPAPDNHGEVVIYRESSFVAGGVPLAVGADSNAFALIENSEYVRAQLTPGKHEIFVRAHSADPTRVNIDISRDGRVCLKAISSKDTLAKTLIPVFLMTSGYHFDLETVPCPSDAALKEYKRVAVNYAQQ